MARRNEAEIILTARDRTKSAFASVNKNFGRFAGAAGVAGAVFALTSLTRAGLQSVDVLAKTAKKLGLTTQALAGLRLAADKTGIAQRQLDIGIQRATRRIAEAADGSGEAKAAIEELGLSAKELVNVPVDEQMKLIADAFENVTGQANRVRLGFKLFDAEGVGLINTLAIGRKGLDEAAEAVQRYGTAISAVEAQSVEEANDALKDAKEAVKGLSTQLAVRFAPAITDAAKSFGNMVVFINTELLPALGFAAERLGLVRLAARALSDIEIRVRLELEQERVTEAQETLQTLRAELEQLQADAFGFRRQLREVVVPERISRAEKDAEEAAARLIELQGELDRRAEIELAAERKLAEERQALREQFRIESAEKEAEAQAELNFSEAERDSESLRAMIARRLAVAGELRKIAFEEADEHKRQIIAQGKFEEQAAERTVALRQMAAVQGIRALQTLFAKSKTISRALFLVEKGLAIARTVQNTAAASVKVFADLPYPAAIAAAASIQAFGATQIALIAATAITGVGAIGGGSPGFGGGTGFSSGGGFDSGTPAGFEDSGQGGGTGLQSQGVVQLIFPNVFGITPEAIDAIAEALREASANRDVIIVSGTGANAEILRGANG